MSSFQDSHSASDKVVITQNFSPGSNDQDMESTLLPKEAPVSNFNMNPSSSGPDNQKLPFTCDICNRVFSRKNVLVRHKKYHSGEKPFSCNICEKKFVQKSDLLRHKEVHSKMSTMHNCDQCSEVFSRKFELLKHRKIHKSLKQHNCDQCNEVFSRKSDLLSHRKIHKHPKQHKCTQCSEVFSKKCDVLHHMRTSHIAMPKCADTSLKDMLYDKVKHFKRQNALNVFTHIWIDSNEDNDQDFHTFFNSIRSDVLNELNYQLEEKKKFKWYAVAQAILSRVTQDGDLETTSPYFHSKTVLQLTDNNLSGNMEDAFAKIIDSFEKFTQRGSGWTLEKITNLELSSAKYGMV